MIQITIEPAELAEILGCAVEDAVRKVFENLSRTQLSLVPEEKPKKSKADPRFAQLRSVFEEEFLACYQLAYRWQGPKDSRALNSLISVSEGDFRSKARAGLRGIGYAKATTVAQLAAKWNDVSALAVKTNGIGKFDSYTGRVDFATGKRLDE